METAGSWDRSRDRVGWRMVRDSVAPMEKSRLGQGTGPRSQSQVRQA